MPSCFKPLLAIVTEQIHVIFIAFVSKIHPENQINNCAGYTLLTDSHEILNPVQDREVKNHTLSRGTSPYKGVLPPPPQPGIERAKEECC